MEDNNEIKKTALKRFFLKIHFLRNIGPNNQKKKNVSLWMENFSLSALGRKKIKYTPCCASIRRSHKTFRIRYYPDYTAAGD